MSSVLDNPALLAEAVRRSGGPIQVGTHYQPGPTEYPIGGVASFPGGQAAIIGWGGRSRLEAAAVTIFAALYPSWQSGQAEAAEASVSAAEALLNALDKRTRKISNELKQSAEG